MLSILDKVEARGITLGRNEGIKKWKRKKGAMERVSVSFSMFLKQEDAAPNGRILLP